MRSSVLVCTGGMPSTLSQRMIVLRKTGTRCGNSLVVHRNNARATRICSPVGIVDRRGRGLNKFGV